MKKYLFFILLTLSVNTHCINLTNTFEIKNYKDETVFATFTSNVLVTINSCEKVKLFSLNGDIIGKFICFHDSEITCLSACNKYVVTGDCTGKAKIWDVENGKEIQTLNHENKISSISINKDCDTIATCGTNGTIKVWDTNGELFQNFNHSSHISCSTLSNDGSYLITGGDDNVAKVWDLLGISPVPDVVFNDHDSHITAVAISDNNEIIVTGSCNGIVKIWNSTNNFCNSVSTITLHSKEITSLAISNDNNLAIGSRDGFVSVWNLWNGSFNETENFTMIEPVELIDCVKYEIPEFQCDKKEICCVGFSEDSKKMIAAINDPCIDYWQAAVYSL